MITLNTAQTLGRKAFWLMFGKNVLPAFVSLILTLIVAVGGSILLRSVSGATAATLVAVLSYAIDGLALITVIIFLFALVSSLLEYENYTFMFEDFDVKMKKGVLSQKEVSIPYRQIQNVTIERCLSYRLLGLSSIVMETSGNEGTAAKDGGGEVVLEPIDVSVAEEIRLLLQRKVGVQVVETERAFDASLDQPQVQSPKASAPDNLPTEDASSPARDL